MSKNECGKTRAVENPYEIWISADQTWEYRVLKKYQNPEREKANPTARWFCAVSSPITREQMESGYELGDCYVSTVKNGTYMVADIEEYLKEKKEKDN